MCKGENNLSDSELMMFTRLFNEFDKTSLSLKRQYVDLQSKVEELLTELEEKNDYLADVYQKQQRTNNLLYSILDNLSSGVLVFDEAGEIVICNNRASDILKKSSSSIIGSSFKSLFRCESDLIEEQRKGNYFLEKEINVIVHNTGLPLHIKTSVLLNDKDVIEGFIHLFDDISNIKNMEEDLRKSRNLSEIGQMSAAIAHEIRNPLGGISGFATMLHRDLEGDRDKQELVEKIQEGVKTLNRITTNVLTFNREIITNNINLKPDTITDSCVELLGSELANENIEFEIIKEYPSKVIEVETDPDLLKRVILNILRNAAQAVETDNIVKIVVNVKFNILSNKFFINISDNGCGIEKESLKKLFTPFYTSKAEGTGLGLAVCKRIIEALNGKIEIDSSPGEGTTVKIKLPIKQM